MSVDANMSETRRPLGSLSSFVNVSGEEAVGRRVPRERTHTERVAWRMHERREETWRPLNRRRVAAFIELYLLSVVYMENAHRHGYQTRASCKMMNKALVHRVIPWINMNRSWTRDESQWPISVEHFRELDNYLVNHAPSIHAGFRWQNIIYFIEEMKKEQERWCRLDEMDRDVMESVRRCLEF